MRSNYAHHRDEWAYEDIPRQIIVEELLDDSAGRSPRDIKVLVFNQHVRIVQIDEDRFGDHRRMFFDAKWNELPIYDFVPAPTFYEAISIRWETGCASERSRTPRGAVRARCTRVSGTIAGAPLVGNEHGARRGIDLAHGVRHG